MTDRLLDIFNCLLQRFGPQHWWPAETPFEVIVGAILTQNTNWKNVEKAIINLRQADMLCLHGIHQLETGKLEALIRPSGFFRQKAARLHSFIGLIMNRFDGDLDRLLALPVGELRKTLLEQPGIGPETADSIILYAADKPSFVVDAYTQRIFSRVGLLSGRIEYDRTRALFMENLPRQTELYNEYHALIVRLAKMHCRKRQPLCSDCPLLAVCKYGQTACQGLTGP